MTDPTSLPAGAPDGTATPASAPVNLVSAGPAHPAVMTGPLPPPVRLGWQKLVDDVRAEVVDVYAKAAAQAEKVFDKLKGLEGLVPEAATVHAHANWAAERAAWESTHPEPKPDQGPVLGTQGVTGPAPGTGPMV